jgi:hypothetical protein
MHIALYYIGPESATALREMDGVDTVAYLLRHEANKEPLLHNDLMITLLSKWPLLGNDGETDDDTVAAATQQVINTAIIRCYNNGSPKRHQLNKCIQPPRMFSVRYDPRHMTKTSLCLKHSRPQTRSWWSAVVYPVLEAA